jgi:ABC-2 type transport system permease protein
VIAAIRAEWIKVRTVRMHVVLVLLAIGFPAVIVVLTALLQDTDNMSASSLFDVVTGAAVVSALVLGVLATASVTGEFGFNTIRPTLAAMPRRLTVITSKAVVGVGVSLVVQTIVVVGLYALASVVGAARGAELVRADVDQLGPATIGSVALAVLVSLLGLGLGLLVRNTPAAVAVLLLWPLIIEQLVGGLLFVAGLEDAPRWLPFVNGITLGLADRGEDAFSRVASGAYFGAFAVALLILGSFSFSKRDA